MAISKEVVKYATENGYDFYVQGLGYRALVEITDLKGNHISWTSNKSVNARNSINALIKQRELDAASDEAIATEAAEAISDLLPPVVAIDAAVAEQAYQELHPVFSDERRYYERPSYLGIGIEVYCGRESRGYALAELLDRSVEFDYTLDRQHMDRMMDRDCDRVSSFAMSARHSCGALI